MPTISFNKNEKRAVKGAAQVGAAMGGAIAGAVIGAARGGRQHPHVVVQQAQPMGYAQPVYAQPVYAQQPPVVLVQQQRQPMRQHVGPGNIVGAAVSVAAVAQGAFSGNEFPPRDAYLCCGSGCCYTAVTSRNWARCHNHLTCCCCETQSCCCYPSTHLQPTCCVDHLGCKAPTFECCNCGMCCFSCKIVSPYHTGEICTGHSQCCLQVSAVAIPCSVGIAEKMGVPCLWTLLGCNVYPAVGCCLVVNDAMAHPGGHGHRVGAPAFEMVR